MIDALELIFSAPVLLWDWGIMNIGYAIGREITPDEISVLQADILPRPMGVVIYPREWYDPADYFAMAEDTGAGAAGFADDSGGWPGTGGGRLAEEF